MNKNHSYPVELLHSFNQSFLPCIKGRKETTQAADSLVIECYMHVLASRPPGGYHHNIPVKPNEFVVVMDAILIKVNT